MRILLVEDDTTVRNVLRLSLKERNCAIDEASDGERGSYLARVNRYDAIILDNDLPKKRGAQVCREVRAAGCNTPILILSALSNSDEKVQLLENGADDYMTKPFAYGELIARLQSLLRRPPIISNQIFAFGDMDIDFGRQMVYRGGKKIYLTQKEYAILEFLVKNQGRVVSKQALVENVWDMSASVVSNSIQTHIVRLRKKLGDTKKTIIQNVAGRGYIIDSAVVR